MDKNTKAMAFLFASKVQAIIFFVAAWHGAEYLNKKYPVSYDWLSLTLPLAIVLTLYNFYIVFKFLLRKEKR